MSTGTGETRVSNSRLAVMTAALGDTKEMLEMAEWFATRGVSSFVINDRHRIGWTTAYKAIEATEITDALHRLVLTFAVTEDAAAFATCIQAVGDPGNIKLELIYEGANQVILDLLGRPATWARTTN